MTDTPAVLIFLLVVVAIVVVVVVAYRLKAKRREALATFALRYGLDYHADDPFGLVDWPFRLFTLGEGRGCENVLDGRWQGLPVKAADYWYYTESSDAQGHRSKSYHYFSVAVAEVGADMPPVTIERETVLTRLGGHIGLHDIEFESERFNRRFRVRAGDREFAFRLVDARMMQWLLAMGEGFGFEVCGPKILVHSRRRKPDDLVPLFGVAKGFNDHVPRLVWTEYGIEPRGETGGGGGVEEPGQA
jgi:hypothetical protein